MNKYSPKQFFLPCEENTEPDSIVSSEQEKDLAKSLALCSSEAARRLLSYKLATKYHALPISLSERNGIEVLRIAVQEPFGDDELRVLKYITEKTLAPTVVPANVLGEAIVVAYKRDSGCLEQSHAKLQEYARDREREKEPELTCPNNEVTSFLSELIEYGLANRASDIHIFPKRDGSYLKMRVDGELRSRNEALCSPAGHKEILRRIKVLARLDITQTNSPSDGSFLYKDHSVRVSTIPTLHGEKAVLRLSSVYTLRNIAEIGYPDELEILLQEMKLSDAGMVVICGSTGSGKTTSLYALLQNLTSRECSAQTIEDPVEFDFPHICQTQINPSVGLTYPTFLKTALRQDPDLLMIGEVRDAETANIAFEAAMTGHLILTSFHAGSIEEALERFRLLGVSEQTIGQAMRLIIHQSLQPKICKECKVLNVSESIKENRDVYRAVGCKICDYSGYHGRAVIAAWKSFN